MAFHQFSSRDSFTLESGETIPQYELGYTTYGTLNEMSDNVVWIFHAFTANSNPVDWWPLLVGEGKLFDPEKYFVICVNMPGSCYGSTGPLSINPNTNKPYFHDFPFFTTRDMIRSYQRLRKSLGIRKIKIGIGGSMGGQQLLEWAIEEPDLFEHIYPIATNAEHSPWGRAFGASQRLAIETDATWKESNEKAGLEGMKVARGIALLSYRNYYTYESTQVDNDDNQLTDYRSDSYQRYQGEKLAKRFNAFSYYYLSMSMDAHNVGRARGGISQALGKIRAKTTVLGIETDLLFPLTEQKLIAKHIPGAHLHILHSKYGHDGFLLEFTQIEKIITEDLNITV